MATAPYQAQAIRTPHIRNTTFKIKQHSMGNTNVATGIMPPMLIITTARAASTPPSAMGFALELRITLPPFFPTLYGKQKQIANEFSLTENDFWAIMRKKGGFILWKLPLV
jgi:hypothetical protein